MKIENIKKVYAEISNECNKKLRILAIQKEISLGECIREILERSVSKKVFEEVSTD